MTIQLRPLAGDSMDRKRRFVRNICWLGCIGSFLYSTPGTAEAIRIDIFTLIRGILPIFCYFLGLAVFPKSRLEERGILGATDFFLWLFLSYTLLSSLWSHNPTGTFLKSLNLIFAYLCVIRIPTLYPDRNQSARGIFQISNLFILICMFELLLFPELTYVSPAPFESKRLGIFAPQIGSNLLGIVVLVSCAGILTGQTFSNLKWKSFKILFLCTQVLILILAHSRLILVTVLIALFFLSWIQITLIPVNSIKGVTFRIFLFLGVIFSLIVLINSSSFRDLLSLYFNRGQDNRGISTLTGRTTVWSEAINFGQQRPLFGWGFYAGHRYALGSTSEVIRNHNNLDNTWLEVFIDLGLIGVLLLMFTFFTTILRCLKLKTTSRNIYVIILIVILSNSIYNPGITMPSSTLLFFGYILSDSRQYIVSVKSGSREIRQDFYR